MFGIYRKSMYFYYFIDVVKTKNCYQMTVIFFKLNVKIGFKDSTVWLYLYYNVNAFYTVLFIATEVHVFTEWAKKRRC